MRVLSRVVVGVQPAAAVGTQTVGPWYLGFSDRDARIVVRVSSTGSKQITICDDRSDDRQPRLEIDPSGPQSTIVYFDGTSGNGECDQHVLGYKIRKMRVSVRTGFPGTVAANNWVNVPVLPYADF